MFLVIAGLSTLRLTDPRARAVWVVSFLLTNATAQFVLGRPHAVVVHQWGLPILAFPVLAWWGSRCANGPIPEAHGEVT